MNFRFDYLETVDNICFETILIDKGVELFPEDDMYSALESCIIDIINENTVKHGFAIKPKDGSLFKFFDFYVDHRDEMTDKLYVETFCNTFLYSSPRHSSGIEHSVEGIIIIINQEVFSKLAGHVSFKESNSDTRFHTFATGAVRDIQKGKGRVDLVPLDVVQKLLFMDSELVHSYSELSLIEGFKESKDVDYLYKTLISFSKNFDGGVSTMILDVSSHFESCLEKYEKDNWKKGIPVYSFINSGSRHYLKWFRRDCDEHHELAFVWNILCCIATIEHGYYDQCISN